MYTIEMSTYVLNPGDSLLFAAHLPHCWQNVGETTSRSLLIMCPTDESDHPTERHFKPEHSTDPGTLNFGGAR